MLVSTFNIKDSCLFLNWVTDEMKHDIRKSSFATEEESKERIDKVRQILNKVLGIWSKAISVCR